MLTEKVQKLLKLIKESDLTTEELDHLVTEVDIIFWDKVTSQK